MDVVDEPKHKLAEWARSIGTQVSREVPIFCEPLNFCLPGATEDTGCPGTVTSNWVL